MKSGVLSLLLVVAGCLSAAEPPAPHPVELQPFAAATDRLLQALEFAGSPLPDADVQALRRAMTGGDADGVAERMQEVLDRHVLAVVHINPESRVSVAEGPVRRELIQQGWRNFLVKVVNEAGITSRLQCDSPQSLPVFMRGTGARERPMSTDSLTSPADVPGRFLDVDMFDRQPLTGSLSGLAVEYRILQLFSRDAGKREAVLRFHAGHGSQDLGFRSELPVLFDCLPAVEVTLGVRDDSGPVMAAFTILDHAGRACPNPSRRLAPDFFFHQQVYRADGESVLLPPGEYQVKVSRGPEYREQHTTFRVPEGVPRHREEVRLERWIHPKARGWFSGDHHVHAAGCAHYDSPTEGVRPEDMMRHILGEDLNVGCVLSWGPCWYFQKQFFEGRTSPLSRPDHLMRYDIEVSGFPSSHAGHLCLLRLREDDYPGTTQIGEWPSWTLPVLAWGRRQGGVAGYSHSGWGLALPDVMPDGSRRFRDSREPAGWTGKAASTLPDPAMPPFDGIGANEFIVTGPAGECDFISAVDTPAVWELNIWYHMLNCGITTRISGETDFPCIYGERVGLGRSYVRMPSGAPLDFDSWVQGIKDGRSYCGDGLSHLFDFRATAGGRTVRVGEDSGDGISLLNSDGPATVTIRCDAAALLAPSVTPETERIRQARLDDKPYWHIERCRIGDSRDVGVELIVNSRPVAKQSLTADGTVRPLTFETRIEQSSWIALRIFPSVHTNPIWVHVGGKPVRASRESAGWCRRAVDVCREAKFPAIRESEREAARAAYDAAARYYEAVLAESP